MNIINKKTMNIHNNSIQPDLDFVSWYPKKKNITNIFILTWNKCIPIITCWHYCSGRLIVAPLSCKISKHLFVLYCLPTLLMFRVYRSLRMVDNCHINLLIFFHLMSVIGTLNLSCPWVVDVRSISPCPKLHVLWKHFRHLLLCNFISSFQLMS